MELVYLWVEKYKNIEKQGFNFSPRFECKFYDEYDEDGKLKDDCKLVICDKKQNEVLDEKAQKCKPCKDNNYIENFFGDNVNITAIVGENGSGKSSLLELLHNSNLSKYLIIKVFFNGINLTVYSECKLLLVSKEEIKKVEDIEIPLMNISHFHNEDIDLVNINYISVYRNRMFLIETDGYDENDITTRYKAFKTEINYFLIFNNEVLNFFETKFNIPKSKYIRIDFLRNVHNQDNYHVLNSLNQLFYIIFSNKYIVEFLNDNEQLDCKKFRTFMQGYDPVLKEEIDNFLKDVEVQENRYIILNIEKKLKVFTDLFERFGDPDCLENFELTLYDDKKQKIYLSSGEMMMLMYIYIFDQKNSIFAIDEIELYLHPQWQKSFIAFISKLSSVKHLILTTHSPFLLSDLPKENIIFLKDGKQVYPDIETFGANIHTLLSHGFFMKDGLMGEFAKGKIENIRKFYNKVILYKDDAKYKTKYKCLYEKKQKEFWHIQKIIGEPFLQTIVKNQLEEIELILLGKKEAIDNEIARLQALKESFKDD